MTGPLLLDQRFWGGVCHDRGVGFSPMHLEDFETRCVAFSDAALDPADPLRLQASAVRLGDSLDGGSGDGVSANVKWFADHVSAGQMRSIQPTKPLQGPLSCPWSCRPRDAKRKGGIGASEFEDEFRNECLAPVPGIAVYHELLNTLSDCEIGEVNLELAKGPPCPRECCSFEEVDAREEVIRTQAEIGANTREKVIRTQVAI